MSHFTKVKPCSTEVFALSLSSYQADAIILAFLAVMASIIAYRGGLMVDPILLERFTEDVWFGSDIERVFSNMTLRSARNSRAKVHPLFTLLVFPIVKGGSVITRLPVATMVALLMAATTALWVSLLYVTLRLMGCRRLDAAVFSVLAWSSAALIFWATIPETYLFGSLSMVVPLLIVAIAQTRKLPIWSYVLMSVFSLSITTTNWMAGILATFVNYSRKWTIAITGMALGIVVLLWGVQSQIFPRTTFLTDLGEEMNYTLPKAAGGPIRVLLGFFFHPMVIPGIQVVPSNRNQPEWPMLSVQHAMPGSGSWAAIVAVLLWAVLLGLGAWACWTLKQNLRLRIVVGLGLLGQLILHLMYGEETFLYAIHLIPFLLIACAMATLTQWRSLVLGLAILLTIFAGWHNGEQFFHATEFVKNRGPLRQQVPQQRWSQSEQGEKFSVVAAPPLDCRSELVGRSRLKSTGERGLVEGMA